MVIRGDIAEIFDVEIGNAPIAVVPYIDECDARIKNTALKKHKEKLGMAKDALYFNAGLMLINCQYWRENNVFKQLMDKTTELKKVLKMPDQDVLNILFGKSYFRLPDYNNVVVDVSSTLSDFRESINAVSGCLVLHYTGGQVLRPWMCRQVPYQELFWKNVALTEFYDDLQYELLHNEIANIGKTAKQKITISLLGLFPFLTIKRRGSKISILLFGMIPILRINKG